jgi:hypothetical protein
MRSLRWYGWSHSCCSTCCASSTFANAISQVSKDTYPSMARHCADAWRALNVVRWCARVGDRAPCSWCPCPCLCVAEMYADADVMEKGGRDVTEKGEKNAKGHPASDQVVAAPAPLSVPVVPESDSVREAESMIGWVSLLCLRDWVWCVCYWW